MHPRQTLRTAIVNALIAADTAAGDNVTASRPDRIDRKEAFAIAVYTPGEVSRLTGLGQPLERLVTVNIHCSVRGDDDLADALADEIEAVWRTDDTFGGACLRSVITSTQTAIEDGETLSTHLEITLSATVQTGPAAP